VSREQQQRRQQNVYASIQKQKSRWTIEQCQRGVDPVEVPLQAVEFEDGLLYLHDDRQGNPQVTVAMLANNCLVLDRLCAKRTFHRTLSRFPPAACRKPCIRLGKFGPQSIALRQQFGAFGDQRFRNRGVTSARRADRSRIILFRVAERASHRR
jgi:hypothetical protein